MATPPLDPPTELAEPQRQAEAQRWLEDAAREQDARCKYD